jgi:NADH-quinone oxidoreductase subunit F
VYCKIEEWDHITGSIRYGHGYPEVPLWSEVPFFKGQKKIVLRNCGLINPDDIEEYIAVGGYQALYKTLIDDKPEGGDRADQGFQAARPRRRGLPHRQ